MCALGMVNSTERVQCPRVISVISPTLCRWLEEGSERDRGSKNAGLSCGNSETFPPGDKSSLFVAVPNSDMGGGEVNVSCLCSCYIL